jgi:hypothetical protein
MLLSLAVVQVRAHEQILPDRDRETERQRDRETERQRDRETERQRDRETEAERQQISQSVHWLDWYLLSA